MINRDVLALAAIERETWQDRMEALVASGVPLNADTATFSAAMKTKFLGPIRDGLHKGKVLLFGDSDANPTDFRGIMRSAENIDFVGNEFRIPLKAKRNQAVGFRSENEKLPAPGSSSYTYLSEPLRAGYGVFNITGQLLKAAETNEGAFVTAFKQEMDDTVLSSKLDWNRAAYGDGSGKLFTVRTAETAPGDNTIDVDTTINLRGGEIIDFVSTAGAVISAAHEVTAIDRTNRTITFSGTLAANLTTSHFAVRASTISTVALPNNSQNKEIQGLQSIVSSTGTLHGVNPSSYAFWKSTQTAVGAAISDTVLRNAVDAVGFESGADLESQTDFVMVTTRPQRATYGATLTSLKQFTDDKSVKLHGGFTALLFDEHPIFVDDQCPVGNLFGLSLNDLFWSQASDWEWLDKGGSVLVPEDGYDRYKATLYKYAQLGTTRRNSHFRLTGLTETAR